MPGAVLHVRGENFDPDTVLPATSLRPYQAYRNGEPMFSPLAEGSLREMLHKSGGFKCDVSLADGLLSTQVGDALAFLTQHYSDLARLSNNPTITDIYIDFGYNLRLDGERVMVQCDFLPHELLRVAGELRIAFELSLYPPLSNSGD